VAIAACKFREDSELPFSTRSHTRLSGDDVVEMISFSSNLKLYYGMSSRMKESNEEADAVPAAISVLR
jgi:hypothetical protein